MEAATNKSDIEVEYESREENYITIKTEYRKSAARQGAGVIAANCYNVLGFIQYVVVKSPRLVDVLLDLRMDECVR